jgi:hypothetical protein
MIWSRRRQVGMTASTFDRTSMEQVKEMAGAVKRSGHTMEGDEHPNAVGSDWPMLICTDGAVGSADILTIPTQYC